MLAFLTLGSLIVADNENSLDHVRFTSDCLLERRQTFHRNLLERVKDYHEVRGCAGNNWDNKKCVLNFGAVASCKVATWKTDKLTLIIVEQTVRM
jgi:hypothetical protein